MNSSERSRPLWDPQQITFIMLNRFWWLSKKPFTPLFLTDNNKLNRFWWLSKKPFTPLFLTDNIKLDEIPTKIKLKIQPCFTLYFKFWEGTSVKSYKIQLPVLLFLVLHQFLYQILFFTNFLELHSILSEKDFCHKFYFFNGFTQNPW